MRKNLFLESLTHLGVTTSPIKVGEISVPLAPVIGGVQEMPAPTKTAPDTIYLGKGLTFKDPEEAYQSLLTEPIQDLPEKYRNTLTKSFFNGTEEGQINTLYKDWKKYQIGIFPKISEFFAHIKTAGVEKYPICLSFVEYLKGNRSPSDIYTYCDGKVNLLYFKFWVIFKYYIAQRKVEK